ASTSSKLIFFCMSAAPRTPRTPVYRGFDSFQAVHHAIQAFGMPDNEIPAGSQCSHDARDYFALGFRVEINKDVAQKDKVEFTNRRERLIQVDLPEHQTLTQFRSNEERSVLRVHALQAKARQVLGRNVVEIGRAH